MNQIPLSPEIINSPIFSVDFILSHKEEVVDFFGDNRHWYKKLLESNASRSPHIVKSGGDVLRVPPKTPIFLHSEASLVIDDENPPLDPSLINEGRAEVIALFFKVWKEAQDGFIEFMNTYKKSHTY